MKKKDKSENGLVIVYTGDGKGKTTAALGLCIRAVGHGNKVRIIQFIKGNWPYGELEGLKRLNPEVEISTLGTGCVGIMGDDKPIEEHHRAARQALSSAAEAIRSERYDIVVLDEVNVAVDLNLITLEDVLDLIENKPEDLDLVLTGRQADKKIIEKADLVTEMKEIKHPFRKGRLAKKGIDF